MNKLKVKKGKSGISEKALQSRMNIRQRQLKQAGTRNDKMKFVFMIAGGLLVVGLILNVSFISKSQERSEQAVKADLTAIEQSIHTSLFEDTTHGFKIARPEGWIDKRSEHEAYALFLQSPNDPDMAVIVSEIEDDTFPALLQKLDTIDSELGISIEHEILDFNGRKAVKRIARLAGRSLLMFDFAEHGRSHHLQFSAHNAQFEQFLPAMEKVLKTYEPTR